MQFEAKTVWVGGVAAGLAAGLTASKSQASIIYTAVSETVNASNTSAGIDFQNNEEPSVSIDYDATNGLTLQKQNSFEPGYIATSPGSGVVAALPYGEVIDGTDSYSFLTSLTDPPVYSPGELNNGDGSTGQFVESIPPQVQYIGVLFQPESGGTDYGWIGFEVTDDSSLANLSGVVTGFAYEDSGNGIAAGAVPEPSSLMLLAMGAVGLAGYRRRSANSSR